MRKLLLLTALLIPFMGLEAQNENNIEIQRETLIKRFVNAYQQSYEKKQMSFIKHVFSDDALIITQTLEPAKVGNKVKYGGKGKKYKLIAENKKQYVKRLQKIFDTSTRILLNVSGLKIVSHRVHENVYGVTFHQLWLGDGEGTFKDEKNKEGYIFLMIDFTNSEIMPTIQIRTWQPEKAAKEEGVFNLYDFELI